MGFTPKLILADNVEGLGRRRSRRRRARGWVALVLLLALLPLLAWGYANLDRVGSLLLKFQKGSALPPETLDVFSKMSMLSQPQRAAAPDFFLRTPEGQNHTLSQHRGRVVLLNFWATWCPPCVREMPAMERLYAEFKDRGLDIVAISVDQGKIDEVRGFAEKLKLTFPIVLDPAHDVKNTYQIRALPTTYVVDREGRIIAWGMGSREWDSPAARALIEHLLGGKAPKRSGTAAAPPRKDGRRG
ncbi:MAG: TlpA family protein disulfide reductase [Candidatus Tectomicrobia bacterium]|uniref:TlpA family protein disulfide reductase n=1 Tax=Tectimicrobiota bacterium TaxID=2528274 RepID=A0A932MPU0_UNCTE|nr:TlpA family protein disulfide reductase [Candidatus Tectomicrobia bacterium]